MCDWDFCFVCLSNNITRQLDFLTRRNTLSCAGHCLEEMFTRWDWKGCCITLEIRMLLWTIFQSKYSDMVLKISVNWTGKKIHQTSFQKLQRKLFLSYTGMKLKVSLRGPKNREIDQCPAFRFSFNLTRNFFVEFQWKKIEFVNIRLNTAFSFFSAGNRTWKWMAVFHCTERIELMLRKAVISTREIRGSDLHTNESKTLHTRLLRLHNSIILGHFTRFIK